MVRWIVRQTTKITQLEVTESFSRKFTCHFHKKDDVQTVNYTSILLHKQPKISGHVM